jgi:hypothetical protein
VKRRELFKAALVGAAGARLAAPLTEAAAAVPSKPMPERYARGIEGQRKADQGNGTYLNPIIAGDHADPAVLKDGDDYYMTFSSFMSYPGVVIWHSRDLVNWAPVTAALSKPIGAVWSMDLVKHKDRYYIYIPAGGSIHVIHAERIQGPWSDPIDLKLAGCIDPGHALGEDGKRYLGPSHGPDGDLAEPPYLGHKPDVRTLRRQQELAQAAQSARIHSHTVARSYALRLRIVVLSYLARVMSVGAGDGRGRENATVGLLAA